uniref:alpha-glucosidase n=1 Tax=Romanomermis culicivorax TaxID=13658 RepID=A0A915HN53_ROMCU
MASNEAPTLEANGGGVPSPHEPLISNQIKLQLEDDMARTLEDKEDVAVYKSTVDKVDFKSSSKYVGLTKEELERYVDDPYWKKMRYFCLGLFWLAWIGMFVAAIAIVISSPKCPPKPQLKWWQKKTCYQLWTRSYKDSNGDGVGDLAGLTEQLKFIGAFKASAIWPTPILKSKSASGYDVLDHRTVDPALGTIDDFKNLVETAHQKNLYIIMDLPLTTVSTDHEWFNKSANKVAGYENHFHWSTNPAKKETYSSVSTRSDLYMHWGRVNKTALLNWDSNEVREAMKQVAKFWLDYNVDGFYLGEVQYMALKDDQTPDWAKIHEYLKEFTGYIRSIAKTNNPDREITLFTSPGFKEPEFGIEVSEFKLAMKLKGDLDYVINNELTTVDKDCEADCLAKHLKDVAETHTNLSWPMWEIGHPFVSRVASRTGSRERGEMISLLLLNLPGPLNLYYGDEIGMVDGTQGRKIDSPRAPMQWNEEKNAGFSTGNPAIPVNNDSATINFQVQRREAFGPFRMYRRMMPLRQSEDAYKHGNMTVISANNLLIVNTSSNYSSTHYVTLLNFDAQKQDFDLTKAPFNLNVNGSEAMFITGTTNVVRRDGFAARQIVDPAKIHLVQNEAIVLRFKSGKHSWPAIMLLLHGPTYDHTLLKNGSENE